MQGGRNERTRMSDDLALAVGRLRSREVPLLGIGEDCVCDVSGGAEETQGDAPVLVNK